MKGRKFQSKCLFCDWLSDSVVSVVIAGNMGARHARKNHPNSEGLVAVIVELTPSSSKVKLKE